MKYMLLVYGTENAWNEEERAQCMADATVLCHELASTGQYLGAAPLFPIATATCVRVRNGSRLTTDGPFAETTEQLGGYFLIDVGNLDESLAVAGRIPAATKGTVEIRPVFEVAGLPQAK